MNTEELLIVPVKVNPVLREYILATNGGSDILCPDYKGELWVMVKSRLQLVPPDYAPSLPGPTPGYIRISLPKDHSKAPLYNFQAGRVIETNTLFRCHLDSEAQRRIEHFMMKGFKKTFRDFMTGAVTCSDSVAIKQAIDKFCETFNLPMESITYEMLRKDWYRYRFRDSRGDPSQEVKNNI